MEAVAFSLHFAPTLEKNGEGLAIPSAIRPNSHRISLGDSRLRVSLDTLRTAFKLFESNIVDLTIKFSFWRRPSNRKLIYLLPPMTPFKV